MSASPSRQQLAKYAAVVLMSDENPRQLAAELAAELVSSGRKREAKNLIADINYELENKGEITNALITTVEPLSQELKKNLQALIKQKTGTRHVALEEKLDPRILGGVKISTARRSWDYSLQSTLQQLRKAGR